MTEADDQVFAELVQFSQARYDEAFESARIDDVLLGAVVGSVARSGYSLIGLHSDGMNHHLRFERLDDQTRLLFRLSHLSEDLTAAKVHGHLGAVVIGYGERIPAVADAQRILAAELSTLFEAPAEPGVVSFATDPTHGHVYSQVFLVLDLDRYFREGFQVDLEVFEPHITSVVGNLRKILLARLDLAADKKTPPPARAASHQRELLESRDEIFMGEIIAAMGEERYALVGLSSDVGHHRARFVAPGSRGLRSLSVAVDVPSMSRKSITLSVRAEVRTRPRSATEILGRQREVEALIKSSRFEVRQEHNAISSEVSRRLSLDAALDTGKARAQAVEQIRSVLGEGRERLAALT